MLYNSGKIKNSIYGNKWGYTDDTYITETPDIAFYKDGKALNALCPEFKSAFDSDWDHFT